jgi:hypothetical protein
VGPEPGGDHGSVRFLITPRGAGTPNLFFGHAAAQPVAAVSFHLLPPWVPSIV